MHYYINLGLCYLPSFKLPGKNYETTLKTEHYTYVKHARSTISCTTLYNETTSIQRSFLQKRTICVIVCGGVFWLGRGTAAPRFVQAPPSPTFVATYELLHPES